MALSGTVGSYSEFGYTGGMQQITIPADGIYKLEVYGAQGGNAYSNETGRTGNGGKGGYSIGYVKLTKGQTIYICVGGAGTTNGTYATYNGGGNGYVSTKSGDYYGSGGGATHIANITGTLSSIGTSNKSKILIVAGGGGGAYASKYGWTVTGGTGGGTSGGDGSGYGDIWAGGTGGTQTTGYAFGLGIPGALEYSGGGGGLYGGTRHGTNLYVPSGGGSGYIDGVPSFTYNGTTYAPSMSNGQSNGHGYAKITLEALTKIYNLNIDGSVVQTAYLDGVALEQIKFDDVSVFGNP